MQRDLLEVLAVQEVCYRVFAMQRATPVHAAAEGSTKEIFVEKEERSHAEHATPFT